MVAAYAALALAAAVALAACSASPPEPPPPNASAAPAAPPATPPADSAPQPLRVALASSDLAVGPNRVAFGVIDDAAGAALNNAQVQVFTYYLPPGAEREGPIQTAPAVFRSWPVAPAGVYTTQLSFDRPGDWGIGVAATTDGGPERTASVRVRVAPQSATPAIGSPAPPSASKTLTAAADIAAITTDPAPDPSLYALTIADALALPKPLLVAFSTPAFCRTATCGPQLSVVKSLKADYQDKATFIHIEIYDNPLDLRGGDLSAARLSPTVSEWSLPSEPWTFVIDSRGIIRAKFEAFATRQELESALTDALNM